jgi:hypothetical protein
LSGLVRRQLKKLKQPLEAGALEICKINAVKSMG